MEVGAVKQAFNNEVILLKKKLNQAKIQIIHKLTRKAKQLTEKKAPEALKEKLKRKAESAVKEVLIIKKIKPKDLAEFIVTHKGGLNTYLNKPEVDNDKACARLLLHKSLQDKYKLIRNKFSDIPIKDLFMSRLERRKMKKEAKEKQKQKKGKGKDKVVNAEGDWTVEDVKMDGVKNSDESDSQDDVLNGEVSHDEAADDMVDKGDDEVCNVKDNKNQVSDDEVNNSENENDKENSDESDHNNVEDDNDSESENEPDIKMDKNVKKVARVVKTIEKIEDSNENSTSKLKSGPSTKNNTIAPNGEKPSKTLEVKKKNPKNKQKELNKTKQFNEKINLKKAKRDTIAPIVENKIADPFFITSTGENYMSVFEPRAPDEFKEEHRQGNRKLRRAVMFGHVPKSRLRQDRRPDNREDHRQNSSRQYGNDNNFRNNKNRDDFNKSTDRNKFNNKREFNDDRGFNKNSGNDTENVKEEKLHPSWEAKKKKSGILPFEGKKIVFD